jgi:hypothetical protein
MSLVWFWVGDAYQGPQRGRPAAASSASGVFAPQRLRYASPPLRKNSRKHSYRKIVTLPRHHELKAVFGQSKAPLVFVTTFPDRKTMVKYLAEIAWETEVWVMDSPTHLIHFNGERFLGPYPA